MKGVISLAMKAAQSDSPVFIWGESGVGKELIASLIHKAGKSNDHPFVGINCSAVPSELIEAEFFGYEEGAFTGAKKGGKKGLFQEANNGTLFLDEITELPLSMQSKLLRVLQENEFMRVGGTKTIPLKVRIISSSNLNREGLANPEKLRRDLYYRLNVIPIFVPPLRDRREDILPIVHFFLKNMNLKYNKKVKISLDILKRLNRYHWPGNIRELKNIIERLVVITEKHEVDLQDYLAACQLETQEPPAATEGQEMFFRGEGDLSSWSPMPIKTAFQKVEEMLIRKAYNETGSIKKTARLLEINPCTIHRKIKKGVIHLE
jgi:transcriptional regulator with PAS, ATPase and Fis domain